jgi:F-type H+-transporting ATPase subunit b
MTRAGVCLTAVLLPLLALAAEAEHGAEAHHGTDWKTLGIAALNFAVLLFVLRRFAGPLIQNFFFQRSEIIRKQLEHAQSRLLAAEAELEDLRRRLRGIDGESQRVIGEMKLLAEQERTRALQRAEYAARRIGEEAQRVADRELDRARAALRDEAAVLSAKLAAEILRNQVRPEDHERLVDEFIARVESAAP